MDPRLSIQRISNLRHREREKSARQVKCTAGSSSIPQQSLHRTTP